MEKRLIFAILLSFLVLFLYQLIFVKKPEIQEVVQQQPVSEKKNLPEEKIPAEETAIKEKKPPEFSTISDERKTEVTVTTTLFRAVWSNEGGLLKSFKLLKHLNDQGEPLELVSDKAENIQIYPFSLSTEDASFDEEINSSLYKPSLVSVELKEGEEKELSFVYSTEKGTRVEKKFLFKGDSYTIDLEIEVWKNGVPIQPRILWGPSFGNPTPEELKQRFAKKQGTVILAGNKLYHTDEEKLKQEAEAYNFVQWAAYENTYFAAIFIGSPQKTNALVFKENSEETYYPFLAVSNPEIAYIGPKELDILGNLGYETKKIIRFGFFGWIAEILLHMIKYIHNIFPNWGVSIIILTIIIKIIFFPLTYSSTKSMAKMQELQPKIKALRAKYKKAKQDIAQRRKMNEEMMKLYKEHGINPAGGCLPLLIQIPIFWGFFRMLSVSINFRRSPFIFWIKDLSVKDPFYVTPILMGITQFISQKMTPTGADPTQQKMMLIMPVVMTIFFMNFQSGLVLYWLTNNVLQIGQQYIMNNMMHKHKQKRDSHGKKRKK